MKSSQGKLTDTIVQRTILLSDSGSITHPFLRKRDVLYYKRIDISKIQIGDFVVLNNHNHGNINKSQTTTCVLYKTRNSLYVEDVIDSSRTLKISSHSIIGRVYKIERNGKCITPDMLYLIQSTRYLHEINRLVSQFHEQKISYLFLKGLILHLIYEKSFPRRRFADFDLLLKKSDFEMVHKILTHLGYVRCDNSISSPKNQSSDISVEITYMQKHPVLPVFVDIHFEPVFLMTQIHSLDVLYGHDSIQKLSNLFFQTKRLVCVRGSRVAILSTPCLIVYLALHLFHHNFQGYFRLELISKICESIKETDRDKIWGKIAEIIKSYQLENFTYGTFLRLHKYFPASTSKKYLKKLKPNDFHKAKYIANFLNSNDIHVRRGRLREGIQLFVNIFQLSPHRFATKLRIFFRRDIINMIIFSTFLRIRKKALPKLNYSNELRD